MLAIQVAEQVERKINPNFIEIESYKIREAVTRGFIAKIGESRSRNGNVYYGINNRLVNNSVLMHVKDNKCIVINGLVRYRGKMINLIRELEKFSFCIKPQGNGRERVIWNVDNFHKYKRNINIKQIPIERIIESYKKHGELRALPSTMHLHHKAQTWDNRISTTMYIPEEKHKHSKRHLSGRYINSMDSFIRQLRELKMNDEHYRNVTVVE